MIPDEITRSYFTISQVGKALGVSPSTIRYWESYLNLPVQRGAASRRRYTVNDIARLAVVARLSKYCHLSGVKEILRQNAAESILAILEPNPVKEPVMKIA